MSYKEKRSIDETMTEKISNRTDRSRPGEIMLDGVKLRHAEISSKEFIQSTRNEICSETRMSIFGKALNNTDGILQ